MILRHCVTVIFTLAGSVALALMLGCSTTAPVTSVNDPQNTYTPADTYIKYVKDFPQMRMLDGKLPEGILAFKNLTYVNYGARELQLDLYAPEPTMADQRPAIVLVHGGGWRAGYRENMMPLAHQLALRGYVTATISYRLSPEAEYPAAIHDVKAAVRWLRENAKTYGVNPERIAVAGGSAGGQIAALVGMTNGDVKFDPQASKSLFTSDVQAVINIDGLSDFTSEEARKYEDDPRKNPSSAGQWFGGNYATKTALWHEASPIYHVSKGKPPVLFINSSQARFSVGQAEMIKRLEEAKINYHAEKFSDAPHSFWLFYPWAKPTATMMANFLDAQFAYKMMCH